ncbi:divalent-cation tolerance protein CutA [Candidatus Palauibacter sp.]|uniref:divalent-cation tolerance protein CutA n=1 Tax=Candidatus Palauibacter sp. TaxID=3101350 RepID=UPI003AF31444
MSEVVVGLVTGPDREQLVRLGRTLVDERLIACLNVVEGVTSVYRWDSALNEDSEALGILKTTSARVGAVERRIRELHPYDVPEILFLAVSAGSPPYLDWVSKEVAH